MAATLKDIAEEVGLSPVSVSQALRGTGRISAETRRKVAEVARRLKYRPHALAKSMREGRTGIVGLIYSPEGTSRALTPTQLDGIQSELSAHSFELMLGMLPKAQLAAPGSASALLRHWMADGLLINHQIGLPQQIAELVEGDHVPVVWMNSRQSTHCVYFDDFGGAVNAVDHLVKLGHKHIAYADLSHPLSWLRGNEHYSVADRHDGFVAGMKKHGLQPAVWMAQNKLNRSERVQFLVDSYNAASVKPTAMITYGHSVEPVFAGMRLGLSVPRDLSVISFGGEISQANDLTVTTALLNHQELGQRSVRKLLARIGESAQPDTPAEAVPVLISEGQTTAPVKPNFAF